MAHATDETKDSALRCHLRGAVSNLLLEIGFREVEETALETLREMAEAFIRETARSTVTYMELGQRSQPLHADIILALADMGFPLLGQDCSGRHTSFSLFDYAFRPNRIIRRTGLNPVVAPQPKNAAILQTGIGRSHRGFRNNLVPDNLPEFPDAHTYDRTPTHRGPITDYIAVRNQVASRRRDVELALTRFVAKTGRTQSLFAGSDVNPYPLISCARTKVKAASKMRRQTANSWRPPYLDALVTRCQVGNMFGSTPADGGTDDRSVLQSPSQSAVEDRLARLRDEHAALIAASIQRSGMDSAGRVKRMPKTVTVTLPADHMGEQDEDESIANAAQAPVTETPKTSDRAAVQKKVMSNPYMRAPRKA